MISFSGGSDLVNINLENLEDTNIQKIEVPEYDYIRYMPKYDLFIGKKNNKIFLKNKEIYFPEWDTVENETRVNSYFCIQDTTLAYLRDTRSIRVVPHLRTKNLKELKFFDFFIDFDKNFESENSVSDSIKQFVLLKRKHNVLILTHFGTLMLVDRKGNIIFSKNQKNEKPKNQKNEKIGEDEELVVHCFSISED